MAQALGWQKASLFRVFNRGSFQCGGRFYGGFWINLPKQYRSSLLINGQSTVELDFKAIHPTILYHLNGLEVEGDPYDIPGFPKEFRTTVKMAFMALINAKPGIRKLDSIYKLAYPDGWDPLSLLSAIERRHAAIRGSFRTDIGVRLQRLDSDIAELVMRDMRRAHNALVLPVHDSFICAEALSANLQATMLKSYQEVIGVGGIAISPQIVEPMSIQ